VAKSKITEIKLFQKNTDKRPLKNRILVATPTLGNIRIEWASARWGQVIPCNWSAAYAQLGARQQFPMGYLVAEAQNIAVQSAVQNNFEWLFLHEDDVILPPDAFCTLNKYMHDVKYPIVSGLYYLKGNPSEPIAYRGRGNGAFDKFKIGEKVWVDGVPTGCLLIHESIFKLMWKESEDYEAAKGTIARKVFETPSKVWKDPETGFYRSAVGTSDLYWCDRVMKEDVLKRAGWKDLAKKKHPFLLDTQMFCRHIDFATGIQYPLEIK
jgi:hypothetical protein